MALMIEHPELLGDNTKQAELHPRKLHDFFDWDREWKHGLEPVKLRVSWIADQGLPGEREVKQK